MKIQQKIFTLFPFILVFYEITNYLANDMYLPALPILTRDLHTTAHLAQLTLTTWFFGSASMQLILGPLSDRFGRRPILLGGGLIFISSTLVCTFTQSIEVLLIARFFQGCAVCSVITAGYASIHEFYEHIHAIKILAIMSSITLIAPAFGPLMGSIILQWWGWRWIFGILVIWGVTAITLLWFKMPETNPPSNRHSLNWKLLLKNYSGILSNRTFMLNSLIFCLTFLGMIAWIVAGPFLVIQTFKLSTFVFGIYQALVFGCLILASQVVKYFIDSLGAERLITIGLAIAFLGGVLALILTWLFPSFLLGLIFSLMIFTFGSNLAFSPSHRIAIEACSQPMGARIAVFSTLMGLSGSAGSLLVSSTYNGTLPWFGILLFCIVLLASALRWIEQR